MEDTDLESLSIGSRDDLATFTGGTLCGGRKDVWEFSPVRDYAKREDLQVVDEDVPSMKDRADRKRCGG